MKFRISKEAFLDGLQKVQHVVSSRTTLPILSNVLLVAKDGRLQFTTTDLDVGITGSVEAQIEKEGATMEVIASKVGGVEAADGSLIAAKHMIDGGPSVLFDAVALVLSEDGAERLTGEAAARDFVADAFAHCKFIGFTPGATPLLQKAGVDPDADEGLISLDDKKAIAGFIESCRKLRLWSRETAVKL